MKISPILVTIGNFEIRWYSVLILLAVLLTYKIAIAEAKRFGVKKDFMFNLMFWGLIAGIIGARLYYVIFNWADYMKDPIEILKVWNGGLAIHGGMISAFIVGSLYCKKYNVRIVRIADFIMVPVLLAQAIGRWGNFFNGEAHGVATSVATLKALFVPDFVINGMYIDGILYTPTFYFESMICLIAFILLIIIRRFKYIKVGTLSALYLIIYGTLRFFIEISRTDALLIRGYKVAQIVSIIMVLFGIGMIMFISRKGKFEDLYNDKSNMDEIKF